MLAGAVAIRAALEARSRPVTALYLRQDKLDPDAAALERLAREQAIPLQRCPPGELTELLGESGHGGVVALAGPRHRLPLAELLPGAGDRPPFLIILDGVEDPYNLGQALRSLYAAGASGVVLSRAGLLDSAAPIIGRASAGASERLPFSEASAPVAAAFFRQAGLLVVAASKEGDSDHWATDLTGPLCLVIGGEKRGLSRALRAHIDRLITIAYSRSFNHSLGAAAATAVLAFEVARQRSQSGGD
jgi:23S rRNA (guanosine2251-2'-O)-methyltransferase